MKPIFRILFFLFCFFGFFSMEAQVGLFIQTALEKVVPVNDFPALDLRENKSVSAPFPSSSSVLTQKIPVAYNYDHLGLFCKIEVQLEKKFKLPMKFRLGEVQYTEQLEYGPR